MTGARAEDQWRGKYSLTVACTNQSFDRWSYRSARWLIATIFTEHWRKDFYSSTRVTKPKRIARRDSLTIAHRYFSEERSLVSVRQTETIHGKRNCKGLTLLPEDPIVGIMLADPQQRFRREFIARIKTNVCSRTLGSPIALVG